jgi:hypothetical protein
VATDTHATTEELMDVSFSMRRMLNQRKVSNWFSPELPVLLNFYAYNLIWPFRIKANSASLSPAQLRSSHTKLYGPLGTAVSTLGNTTYSSSGR